MNRLLLVAAVSTQLGMPTLTHAADDLTMLTMRFKFPNERRSQETVIAMANDQVFGLEGIVFPYIQLDCATRKYGTVRLFEGVVVRGHRSGQRLSIRIERYTIGDPGKGLQPSGSDCVSASPYQTIAWVTPVEIDIPHPPQFDAMGHPKATVIELPLSSSVSYQIDTIRLR